ncbi:UDP-N-acetylglucosamine diphosphorylase/glucosamine-1-phosphate N-acetyltransferase [Ktedonosporobacter rubrisoli]|uniref:Bifunctional protein GlmU n=1 Tax=Ktedonosporobacter rubrisoli TaxID=2509675 RepID=A0A4P6K4P4_KTERU|nr:bifunctional UDP-N-acetylglucosamine diphosphorylase/glucosamine-1-phosphate N-acetyltransferase GlmU [Ktedonosporobacter rubrisoli]QBD82496.1 UDP-N-acetylglucosamine diphosphorylase/glucosamine-1-phosphate N-acetyltransferase [Ktedonosporobacter rubrisoli]
MNTYATVVLAAGKGTRMRSNLPKVLHPLAGVPLLAHVLNAVESIPSTSAFSSLDPPMATHRPVVVVGHEAAQIEAAFAQRCLYAIQASQLGTGDAVLAARGVLEALEPRPQTILVCYGDTPLIRSELLASILTEHIARKATITFLTALTERESDFGRIVRDSAGRVREIVEVKRATKEQMRIKEVNSGVYCFDRSWLWPVLQDLPRNASGEYYLTDLIGIASAQERVIATVTGTLDESTGINNRVQLAEAEQMLRRRILERHMYAGVTIVDPTTTYIDNDVKIGMDSVILPGTFLTGKTTIGSSCRIGPGTTIDQSVIGDECVIRNSVVEGATFEDGVSMGPFSHCRPGAHLARGVRMGNFAEVKNAFVGEETDMHHFSYIGDATVGDHVNIGAGTITSNYNGITKQKYHTTIGDGAFIGCDTILVPPVTVGEQAMTGAGSVVNKDIPPGALAFGVPARVQRMLQPSHDDTVKRSLQKEE